MIKIGIRGVVPCYNTCTENLPQRGYGAITNPDLCNDTSPLLYQPEEYCTSMFHLNDQLEQITFELVCEAPTQFEIFTVEGKVYSFLS